MNFLLNTEVSENFQFYKRLSHILHMIGVVPFSKLSVAFFKFLSNITMLLFFNINSYLSEKSVYKKKSVLLFICVL